MHLHTELRLKANSNYNYRWVNVIVFENEMKTIGCSSQKVGREDDEPRVIIIIVFQSRLVYSVVEFPLPCLWPYHLEHAVSAAMRTRPGEYLGERTPSSLMALWWDQVVSHQHAILNLICTDYSSWFNSILLLSHRFLLFPSQKRKNRRIHPESGIGTSI